MKKNLSIALAIMLALAAFCSGCSNSATAKETEPATEAATEAPAASEAETEATVPATEEAAPETEAAPEEPAANALPDQAAQDSWDIIKSYDFYIGEDRENDPLYSNLAYSLKSDTLQDMGDCYSIQATFMKNVTVPGDLEEGDTVTFTVDELKGTQVTAIRKGDELVNVEDEGDIYNYGFLDENGDCLLTQYSDDAVGCPIYEGTLIIRKDAIRGIAIIDDYAEITADDLADDPYFNAVAFNEDGMVTELVFYGD